jgi:hypothetical protein
MTSSLHPSYNNALKSVPKHLNPEFLPGFFIMSFSPELTTVRYKLQSNFQNWTSILQIRLIWPHIFSEQFDFKDAKRTSVKFVLEITTVPPAMIIPTHLKQFFRKGNRTKKSKSFPWQKFSYKDKVIIW